MPIYEYKCRECGNEFEALVRKSDTPNCPSCKGTELERLLSLPALKTESTKANALKAAKVPYEGHIYPMAVHGFNNDATPERFNTAASDLAMSRTIAWFNKYVRG